MQELPTITTERLVLRPFALSDAATYSGLPATGLWPTLRSACRIPILTARPSLDRRACPAFRTSRDHGAGGDAAGHRRVGGLYQPGPEGQRRPGRNRLLDGHAILNHGYCSEAARALVAFGFEQMGLHRVYAFHFVPQPRLGPGDAESRHDLRGHAASHAKKWGALPGPRGLRHLAQRVCEAAVA